MEKTVKILLVDDHKLIRNGIKLLLNNQNKFKVVIDEAENGVEALNSYSKTKYDIILMDISMPILNGIEATGLLYNRNKEVKILALSMHNEDYLINKMLEAGAMGYLLKDVESDELTRAILTVLAGKKYFCNDVSQILYANSKNIAIPKDTVHYNSEYGFYSEYIESKLSGREREVLLLLISDYSNAEISEKLNISIRTVEGHKSRIMKKLNLRSTIGLVKYAIEKGLIKL